MNFVQETDADLLDKPAFWQRSGAAVESVFAQQGERLVLWIPVAMAVGIGWYFALIQEPPLWLGIILTLALALGTRLAWRLPVARILLLALSLAAFGFSCAQWRTVIVYTPILAKDHGPAEVAGTILAIENLGDDGVPGARLLLKDLEIEDLAPGQTPRKIRLRVRDAAIFKIGQRVKLLAQLMPPSPPVMPGAFDFQRYLYFQGIGAVGFVYKFIGVEREPANQFSEWAEDMRRAVDMDVAANMPAHQSGIAAALLTGRQTTISEGDKQAMQNSGLAHLLAVSGLNVGLFASSIFFALRFLMALWPQFALRYPVKKIAAFAAFFAACFYLVLAGFVIPAQRAVIMIGMMLVAVMLDRSPLSLRLLAFAAGIVLIIAPESLISASFQMSFAAVAGLILFFERFQEQLSALYNKSGFVRRAFLYLMGVCVTTVVASIATTPLSLYHFQQMTSYGLLANLVAVPLMAFMIMPAAIVALFLMPLGLSFAPLWVMGLGVDWTLAIARFVADLPGAVTHWAMWPPETLALLFGGFIWLVLWRGGLKWLGLIPVVICVWMIATHVLPTMIISNKFDVVAVRGEDGALHVSTLRKQKFAIENWERLYGFLPASSIKWPREGAAEGVPLICDPSACRLEMEGQKISVVFNLEALPEEMLWADVALSTSPVGKPLRVEFLAAGSHRILIDKFDVLDGGAHGLWLSAEGVRVESSEQHRGQRPWSSLNDKTLKAQPAAPES